MKNQTKKINERKRTRTAIDLVLCLAFKQRKLIQRMENTFSSLVLVYQNQKEIEFKQI